MLSVTVEVEGGCVTDVSVLEDDFPRAFVLEIIDRDVSPADELSDVDQQNPVNMSAEAWGDVYARNPDALEHGDYRHD